MEREAWDPNGSPFYTLLISFPIFLPPIKESLPSLGREQGNYLWGYWWSQGTISNSRRDGNFLFTDLARGEHANFQPIENENGVFISNVCHRGFVLLLIKPRWPEKINKYNIPEYSQIAAKNDGRGQEKAKQDEVDNVTFVSSILGVPVWMTADPWGNGDEPVPAQRWRHRQN